MTTPSALPERRAEGLQLLETLLPEAVELRHDLHRHPEVGGEEAETVQRLTAALGSAPVVPVAEGFYRITGKGRGPRVGIRAELDALPVQESPATALTWSSQTSGVSHLCGHDVHMAALVLVTNVIDRLGLDAQLVSVFQPREEVAPSGAVDFLKHPEFLAVGLSAMIGVHLQPMLAAGTFSAGPGAVNASADQFEIRVTGRPAHGAYPHVGRDPVLAAAQLVSSLQALVSREGDPMVPSVLSIGRITGGHTHNAIPAYVDLWGTMRAYSARDRQRLHAGLRRVTAGVATASDLDIEVRIDIGEPVLVNDARLAPSVSAALVSSGFQETDPLRSCGADDFAHYSAHFPSVMIFAGVGPGGSEAPGLHNPAFVPGDEAVLAVAKIMLTAFFDTAFGKSHDEPRPEA